MDLVSNKFSVLGLDDCDVPSSLPSTSDAVAVAVARQLPTSPGLPLLSLPPSLRPSITLPSSYMYGGVDRNIYDTSNNNCKSSSKELVVENGNKEDQKFDVPVAEFKLPLVWIDLEMTGLNIDEDRIVEIACIITDGNLSKSVETRFFRSFRRYGLVEEEFFRTHGPDLVIHQTQECLDNMNEWCQNHHGASGLTTDVLRSTISEREAEEQVIEFVKKHIGNTYKPLLAGNSVYTDFVFLKKYMPDLASLFSHVLVDVSSVRALCIRWHPKAFKKAPQKEKKHRAMDDIRESILELKHYRENIFIKPSKK